MRLIVLLILLLMPLMAQAAGVDSIYLYAAQTADSMTVYCPGGEDSCYNLLSQALDHRARDLVAVDSAFVFLISAAGNGATGWAGVSDTLLIIDGSDWGGAGGMDAAHDVKIVTTDSAFNGGNSSLPTVQFKIRNTSDTEANGNLTLLNAPYFTFTGITIAQGKFDTASAAGDILVKMTGSHHSGFIDCIITDTGTVTTGGVKLVAGNNDSVFFINTVFHGFFNYLSGDSAYAIAVQAGSINGLSLLNITSNDCDRHLVLAPGLGDSLQVSIINNTIKSTNVPPAITIGAETSIAGGDIHNCITNLNDESELITVGEYGGVSDIIYNNNVWKVDYRAGNTLVDADSTWPGVGAGYDLTYVEGWRAYTVIKDIIGNDRMLLCPDLGHQELKATTCPVRAISGTVIGGAAIQ